MSKKTRSRSKIDAERGIIKSTSNYSYCVDKALVDFARDYMSRQKGDTIMNRDDGWVCDYCKKKQKSSDIQYEDHGDKICQACESRRVDSFNEVVHISSMP